MPCFLANLGTVGVKLRVRLERASETITMVFHEDLSNSGLTNVRVEKVVNGI